MTARTDPEQTTPAVEYRRADQLDPSLVHAAFSRGFADYRVDLSSDRETFERRFFDIEHNRRDCSFVALVDGAPAGVILGGTAPLGGTATMRMGAMAIVPEHRGRLGLGRGLFERHLAAAVETGCAQLWLEVIVGNDRAAAFYRRQGYQVVGRLRYYQHAGPSALASASRVTIEPCSLAQARACAPATVHVNWQNQPFCIARVPGQRSFAAIEHGEVAGAIGLDPTGKLDFLYVRESLRRRGLGTALLATAAGAVQPPQLAVGLPDEPSLDAFLLARGFQRRAIEQHEMQRPTSPQP